MCHPSHLPPHPIPLGCYRAPVWVSWGIQQIPIGCFAYISVYASMLLSPFIPHSPFLSPPAPRPQGCSFHQPLLRSNGAPFQPRTLSCGSHTLLLPQMKHLYTLLPHKVTFPAWLLHCRTRACQATAPPCPLLSVFSSFWPIDTELLLWYNHIFIFLFFCFT